VRCWPQTLGPDGGYQAGPFLDELERRGVTPYVPIPEGPIRGADSADARRRAAGFRKRAVDEALVEAKTVALLNHRARVAQRALEDPVADPALEIAVDRALGAERARQVLPLGAVVQNAEDASP